MFQHLELKKGYHWFVPLPTMLFSLFLTSLLITADAVSTPRAPNGTCTSKLQRRAWHTFSLQEKKAYIDAELCLMKLPANLGLTGAKNRFEELQWIHQTQASITHGVVSFFFSTTLVIKHSTYDLREHFSPTTAYTCTPTNSSCAPSVATRAHNHTGMKHAMPESLLSPTSWIPLLGSAAMASVLRGALLMVRFLATSTVSGRDIKSGDTAFTASSTRR